MPATPARRRVAKVEPATPKKRPARKLTQRPQEVKRDSAHTIATVPDKSIANKYVSRSINGLLDLSLLDSAYANGFNTLIEGPTGPGKTMFAMAWAAARGKHFYSIPSNVGIDTGQIIGKFVPDKTNGGFVWRDGGATDIVRNGGLLLINELNFLPDRIATVLFSLLDSRRMLTLLENEGEGVRAHLGRGNCWCDEANCNSKRVIVLGDMNPDYQGTRPLNQALRNRFSLKLWWDYDRAVEEQLVESTTLLDIAFGMRADVAKYETPVSTNSLMEFEKFVALFGLDFAIANFVQAFHVDERTSAMGALTMKRDNLKADYEAIAVARAREAKRAVLDGDDDADDEEDEPDLEGESDEFVDDAFDGDWMDN